VRPLRGAAVGQGRPRWQPRLPQLTRCGAICPRSPIGRASGLPPAPGSVCFSDSGC
jgi:hypothetical protein